MNSSRRNFIKNLSLGSSICLAGFNNAFSNTPVVHKILSADDSTQIINFRFQSPAVALSELRSLTPNIHQLIQDGAKLKTVSARSAHLLSFPGSNNTTSTSLTEHNHSAFKTGHLGAAYQIENTPNRDSKMIQNSLQELKNSTGEITLHFRHPSLPYIAPQNHWDAASKLELSFNSKTILQNSIIAQNENSLKAYSGFNSNASISSHQKRDLLTAYLACLNSVDTQIGQVVDAASSKTIFRIELVKNHKSSQHYV